MKSKLPNFFTFYRIMWKIIQFPYFPIIMVRQVVIIFVMFGSLIELEDQFLWQLDRTQVPLEILHHSRFYPYFKVDISFIYSTFNSCLVNVHIPFLRYYVNNMIVKGHYVEHMFMSKCLVRMHQDMKAGRVTRHKICWLHACLIWNSHKLC